MLEIQKMPKYDVTKLLYKRSEEDRFLNALDIPDNYITAMNQARTLVRNKIKSAFTKARNDNAILERLEESQRLALQAIEPRFWPQGSFVYKTQNMPAQPPQQIDVDDGAYLPIEILRDAPIINKNIFFEIVDAALKELALEQGWDFKPKDTCARLIVSHEIHLDVPLYAIPKDRFENLQKATGRVAALKEGLEFTDGTRLLKDDEIYLARRDRTHWVKSDPMEICDWFNESVETHGFILRRSCRYLKAWRDSEWSTGGPSSIALMICACTVFDQQESGYASDSSALAAIFEKLPKLLKDGVKNPRNKEETIFPRGLSDTEVDKVILTARTAANNINEILNKGMSPDDVIRVFTQHFGTRIPKRSDWIEHLGTATSASTAVLSTPARKTSAPDVPKNMIAG